MPRWPAYLAAVLFWTLLIGLPAVTLTSALNGLLFSPVPIASEATKSWEPASGAFRLVYVTAKGEPQHAGRSPSPAPVQGLTVWITALDSPHPNDPVLWIDPRTMAMEHRSGINPHHATRSAVTPADPPADPKAAFEDWWRANGLDPDDADQRIELEGLWQLIGRAREADMEQYQQVLRSTGLQNLDETTARYATRQFPSPWGPFVLFAGWLLVWAVGMAGLFMLWRRGVRLC